MKLNRRQTARVEKEREREREWGSVTGGEMANAPQNPSVANWAKEKTARMKENQRVRCWSNLRAANGREECWNVCIQNGKWHSAVCHFHHQSISQNIGYCFTSVWLLRAAPPPFMRSPCLAPCARLVSCCFPLFYFSFSFVSHSHSRFVEFCCHIPIYIALIVVSVCWTIHLECTSSQCRHSHTHRMRTTHYDSTCQSSSANAHAFY